MSAIKVSQDLRPMSDLKSHGADIVKQVQETRRPVVLTRHGRGVAVVLSLEDYEQVAELRELARLQAAVDEAEREIGSGQGIGHDEMSAKLQRWASE